MKKLNRFLLPGILSLLVFSQACKKDDPKNPAKGGTFYGEKQSLGNGSIWSFIVLNDQGKPVSIGMKFTSGVLSGLPADTLTEHDTPVPLPAEAAVSGFDHLEIDWNPVGHEPKQIYGLPHFDFHFYLITKEQQALVTGGPDTVSVPAVYVPKDYQSAVVAVPDMGVHWFDVKAAEFSGQKFTDTFIYGFYHGKMAFVEPMITTAFLLSKPDFKLNIKQPQAYQKAGYYPLIQHIRFDESAKEYTMSLENLEYSAGNQY